MRRLSLMIAGTMLASCSYGPPPPPAPPSPAAMQEYQQLVGNKVAQAPVGCIPNYNANDMRIIDGQTLGFRVGGGGSRAYIVHLSPGCEQIGHGNYALLARQVGSLGICRGDIQQVVDLTSHINVGSCTIAEIVPFQRA